jgi:hypothetical protein
VHAMTLPTFIMYHSRPISLDSGKGRNIDWNGCVALASGGSKTELQSGGDFSRAVEFIRVCDQYDVCVCTSTPETTLDVISVHGYKTANRRQRQGLHTENILGVMRQVGCRQFGLFERFSCPGIPRRIPTASEHSKEFFVFTNFTINYTLVLQYFWANAARNIDYSNTVKTLVPVVP